MNALLLSLLASAALAAESRDVHSFARPEEAVVEHADIELTVDFQKKTLSGATILRVARKSPKAPLVLDTRDLLVRSVSASKDGKAFKPAKHEIGASDPVLGAPLTVVLPEGARFVRIE